VPRAIDWLLELLRLSPLAMSATRRLSRRDLVETFADKESWRLDEFAEAWYGAETQDALKALVARLKK
jgi:hypothetical protein